ncbi:CRISPR system CASCADE complex protein CasA [delta proteobacterium NaphS2]|nr:CRISPR system CASCADE complex protein CasA [delta proteobacterium NaphS2]
MNLINDPWIPVIRELGKDRIAPWQIVERDNPVMEIDAPRPDFQGALYQFLIGLLQTCFAPEDEDEWEIYWEEWPEPERLKQAFVNPVSAFELYNSEGVAFMQDYDLPDGKGKEIAALLIEAPGEKTIVDNLDHFVKRNQIAGFCPACTAMALFTLQINSPSGGAGQRVGLRGGGPLTTLIVPQGNGSQLWEKLWLNVLSVEELPGMDSVDSAIMPWLSPTRLSDDNGRITTPSDVHTLQMYWGMPRRIRLESSEGSDKCDLCGRETDSVYRHYRTKKHGINYDGPFVHPLTPYRFDDKKKNPPLSLKGQKSGLGYRHWLSLAFQDLDRGEKAAKIVQFFNEERGQSLFGSSSAALWCFGYDMDNMKARCWYEAHFPVFSLDKNQKENLVAWAGELIAVAREAVKILRNQIKAARFRRPGDAKGDMTFVDQQFWEETEQDFYRLLDAMAKLPGDTRLPPAELFLTWLQALQRHVFSIFEESTLESAPEGLDLKRIVLAKQELKKRFYGNKRVKDLKAKSTIREGV